MKAKRKDRHAPHRMVRVPIEVYQALSTLAKDRDRTISAELRRLIVGELVKFGRWPKQEKT